jgi:hypothetical protein
MTPSRVICSSTITFLMTESLQHLDYDLGASFKTGKRGLKYSAQGAFDAACSPPKLNCKSIVDQQSSNWMPNYVTYAMICMLESPTAADCDESRIAHFGQDHAAPFIKTIFTCPVFVMILTILCSRGSIAVISCGQMIGCRRIFSIAFPFASSSISLSK